MNDLTKFTCSQASQDLFALLINDKSTNGYFVDLGCNEPIKCNNSYLLEKYFNWNGILVDFNENLTNYCRQIRTSKVFCEDLYKKSVTEILKENEAPALINYMSLDLDEGATMAALKSIDFNQYQFKCITFEHDAYLRGEEIREPSRRIFYEANYLLVAKNVKFNGAIFEDWYVHASEWENSLLNKIGSSDGEEHNSIIEKMLQ